MKPPLKPAPDPAPADVVWLAAVNRTITSITTKAHSVRLYEAMGSRAGLHLRPYLYGVLNRVHDLQPVRVSEVAQDMDYDRSTVSRHVAELTALGCIERQPDPRDGRAVILRLSVEGQKVIEGVREAWITTLADITAEWTKTEQEQFLSQLGRFDEAFSHHFSQVTGPANADAMAGE